MKSFKEYRFENNPQEKIFVEQYRKSLRRAELECLRKLIAKTDVNE